VNDSVIACDKREAFAQGSTCDEAIQLFTKKAGLLRGACHRAALCADPLARNDGNFLHWHDPNHNILLVRA
jgi:hypothetical protein